MFTDILFPGNFLFWILFIIAGYITLAGWANARWEPGFIASSVFVVLVQFFGVNLIGDLSMNPLFEPLGILFWSVIVVEFFLLTFLSTKKFSSLATISVLATVAALQFLFGVPIVQYIADNKFAAIGVFVAYVVVGVVWTSYKWNLYTSKMRKMYNDLFDNFLKENNLTYELFKSAPIEVRKQWNLYFNEYKTYGETIEHRPKVREHKNEIIFNMAFWPWSFIEFLFFEFVYDLFNGIYFRISNFLNKIMERNWQGTENDFVTDEELKKEKERKRSAGDGYIS